MIASYVGSLSICCSVIVSRMIGAFFRDDHQKLYRIFKCPFLKPQSALSRIPHSQCSVVVRLYPSLSPTSILATNSQGNSAWQYRKRLIIPLMFLVSKKSSDPILNKQYISHMPLLSSEAFIANITDNILQSKAI